MIKLGFEFHPVADLKEVLDRLGEKMKEKKSEEEFQRYASGEGEEQAGGQTAPSVCVGD